MLSLESQPSSTNRRLDVTKKELEHTIKALEVLGQTILALRQQDECSIDTIANAVDDARKSYENEKYELFVVERTDDESPVMTTLDGKRININMTVYYISTLGDYVIDNHVVGFRDGKVVLRLKGNPSASGYMVRPTTLFADRRNCTQQLITKMQTTMARLQEQMKNGEENVE